MDDTEDRGYFMNYFFAKEHEEELIHRFQSTTCKYGQVDWDY